MGRSFGGLALGEELRAELAQASLDALQAACALAEQHDAAALLIPGDLFDRPEIDEQLCATVRTLFGDLRRPVLVSPGNHDAYGPLSGWNNAALRELGLSAWTENVHIFTTRRLSVQRLLDGELAVHGHRVEGYHSEADSPLADVRLASDARWNVLLFHGALAGGRFGGRTTVPFSAARLAEIGADYAAVGHYHRFLRIEHEGRLLGAYAGVAVPGELDEDPHGGVLLVQFDNGEPRVECVEVHPGRIARLAVHADEPLASVDEAAELIRRTATSARLGRDDVVFVELDGFSQVQIDREALVGQLQADFRHVELRDYTQPDVIVAKSAAEARVTVESQFVETLRGQIECCDDPRRRAVLESARRYGLLALHGRTVRPPTLVPEPREGGGDAD